MRRHRNAKIVATLGPASSTPALIRSLFEAGADVFRLNFSHGTHADHKRRYEMIRALERAVPAARGFARKKRDAGAPAQGDPRTGRLA